jgi:hypothetical protein
MRQMRLNSLSFAPSRHRSDETIIVTDKAVFLYLQVYLSYLEIYNEKIRDLLRPVPGVHLELREDMEQVHVSGLSEVRATSTNEVRFLVPWT